MTELFGWEQRRGERRITALLLLIGVLQVVGYYMAGALVNGDGPLAAPQPDTLLYCQAARRIAEGFPFSFSAGTAVSTGTTSVLYPFVLSLAYFLGAKGDALIGAGFVLNALFYLVYLFSWARVFSILFKRVSLRLTAIVLLALSPQPAYCALAQSDIGLWLAVSGLFAMSFFSGKALAYVPLLALGPWVRPEGIVLIISFCVYAAAVRRKADVAAALAGIASTAGVFALNFAIAGNAQFSSVANKGYFTAYALPQAVYATAADMVTILKEYALGLSNCPPRMFFVVPLFGAICIAYGIVSHAWKGELGRKLGVVAIAVFGDFAMVSMSGWQNTNTDRYLAWTFPLVALFLAEGVIAFGDKIETAVVRRIVVLLPTMYAAGASLIMFFIFHGNSKDTSLTQEFGRQCESQMPAGASIGCLSKCGLAYEFSDRRFAHISGIYSPEFMANNSLFAMEVLKHEPKTRFDYWILMPEGSPLWAFRDALGEQTVVGPLGLELRKADWRSFENAARDPDAKGRALVARVDVGYERDELSHGYAAVQKNGDTVFDPVLNIADGPANGKMVEVARMIAGYDEMSVPLLPGKDVRVVMRTFGSCDVVSRGIFASSRVTYEIACPAKMNISVDGLVASEVEFSCLSNAFSDVEFSIPGSAVRSPVSRIAFLGDHIACCYWFYQ